MSAAQHPGLHAARREREGHAARAPPLRRPLERRFSLLLLLRLSLLLLLLRLSLLLLLLQLLLLLLLLHPLGPD